MTINTNDVRDVINNPEGRTPYPEDTMLLVSSPSGSGSKSGGVDNTQLEELSKQIKDLGDTVDLLMNQQQAYTLDTVKDSDTDRSVLKLTRHSPIQPDITMGTVTLPYGFRIGKDSSKSDAKLSQVVPRTVNIPILFCEPGEENFIDTHIQSYVRDKKLIVHQASELWLPVNSNSSYNTNSILSGLPNEYRTYLKQIVDFSVCVGTSSSDTLLNLTPVNNTEAGTIITTFINAFDHQFNLLLETVQENELGSGSNFKPHKYHIKVTANITPRKKVSQDDWVKLNRISSFIVKKDMTVNNYGTAIEEALANYVGDITFRAEIEYFNGLSETYLERYTSN